MKTYKHGIHIDPKRKDQASRPKKCGGRGVTPVTSFAFFKLDSFWQKVFIPATGPLEVRGVVKSPKEY